MKKNVVVRDVTIGEGIPKICVPIVGRTREEILAQAAMVQESKADVVEWRVDWFDDASNLQKVKETACLLREVLCNVPILFTFRTAKEGGEKEISDHQYKMLCETIVATGCVDLIDVELYRGDQLVRELISNAHEHDVAVIVSNHEFHKTPSKEEIIKRLSKMQQLGADLPKIAVMPENKRDVLELLLATEEMVSTYADRPIITMSMAAEGVISRIAGEVFGSALTFGALTNASAPGQIPVKELEQILSILHRSC